MRLPDATSAPQAVYDPNAIRFALNRLTQAQNAGLIGGPQPLQFSHDPAELRAEYHRYSPVIAHQLHMGASLTPPNAQPMAAPMAHGVQPQTAPTHPIFHAGYTHPAAQQPEAQSVPLPLPVFEPAALLNRLMGID